jgi:hypothetical protein
MAYKLSGLYLSLRCGKQIICESIDNAGTIKARLIVGTVNTKEFGVEYRDGEDVKMINEQPMTAPRFKRMLDDSTSTVFKTVPVHYNIVNDELSVTQLEPKPMNVDSKGEPGKRIKINSEGSSELEEASAASRLLIRSLAERRVKGEDILSDLKLNYGLSFDKLKLVISGMGSWVLLQHGKPCNLMSLVASVEKARDK